MGVNSQLSVLIFEIPISRILQKKAKTEQSYIARDLNTMQGFQYLLLHLCLCVARSCEGKSIRKVSKWETMEVATALEPDLEDQDSLNSRLESFMGTMKEDFLKMLNLSAVPQDQRKVQPSSFMMDLYNKYASDKSSVPHSNVIRSFIIQDVTQSVVSINKTKHRLLFNISIPYYEEVTMVQLRLFTQWDSGQTTCDNTFASISIYDVEQIQNPKTLHFLDRKDINNTGNVWEAFKVTDAVLSWLQSRYGAGELEVEVESWGCGSFKGGGYDISLNLEDDTSPALIVFSDDLENWKRKAKNEVKEMMTHEEETFLLRTGPMDDYENEVDLDLHSRKKRNTKNFCQRTSLRVNFKDIGWDKWFVAPPEYEAYECKGVCDYPLTDDVSPSKHAIIQTLVNLSNPKKANKACCVPTKLDPLTVMYQENGIITVRHFYEEMKVAKCGCR
ncbi:growth/differentiation factor 2 [Electrophorus electricus]|uniref:growth/differentiation factor 2 n=1 Tax=Electrophorus electricus TaxID=8005 RepID=UPI0015CFA780|nr:growth/differentiation factor 2 [Electrophorus electricus]